MRATDEFGRTWLVLEGDPAWNVCSRLKKLQLSTLILPVQTLVRAIVPHPDRTYEQMHKLEVAYRATHDRDVRDAYLRAVRLYDCLSACYNEDGGTSD